MALIRCEPLLAGRARGPLLCLLRPLSFHGGVDPASGMIVDPGSDAYGETVGGTVLALGAARGSSAAAAVLAELARRRLAPAALLLGQRDAFLLVAAIVAREMGWPAPVVLQLPAEGQAMLPSGAAVELDEDGQIIFMR